MVLAADPPWRAEPALQVLADDTPHRCLVRAAEPLGEVLAIRLREFREREDQRARSAGVPPELRGAGDEVVARSVSVDVAENRAGAELLAGKRPEVRSNRLSVDGGPNPRDSGGLPAIWFFLKQRSSWVWFLATAAKVSAAGFGGCSPPRRSLQGAATIRPVQTEARRTA